MHRLSKKEETRLRSLQKQEMIEKVLQTNNLKEEEKRQKYYEKQAIIEQRKKMSEEEQKEHIERKKMELVQKDEQRKNVVFLLFLDYHFFLKNNTLDKIIYIIWVLNVKYIFIFIGENK